MHILSTDNLDRAFVLDILARTAKVKHHAEAGQWEELRCLQNKILASLFFEPSTRTRLSFEAAMKRLGGDVLTVAEADTTSLRKGESLSDSLKTVSQYADVIVMRHPDREAMKASCVSDSPVINAGNGDGEHPTQALLDLFTIQNEMGTIDGLNIMFMGDLKYSRCTKSLSTLLKKFNTSIYFYGPPSMGIDCCNQTVIQKADVIYLVRPQKERWEHDYITELNAYNITKIIDSVKPEAIILHPLPRTHELPTSLDNDPRLKIWQQVRNGLYLRMALLKFLLQG